MPTQSSLRRQSRTKAVVTSCRWQDSCWTISTELVSDDWTVEMNESCLLNIDHTLLWDLKYKIIASPAPSSVLGKVNLAFSWLSYLEYGEKQKTIHFLIRHHVEQQQVEEKNTVCVFLSSTECEIIQKNKFTGFKVGLQCPAGLKKVSRHQLYRCTHTHTDVNTHTQYCCHSTVHTAFNVSV